MVTIVLDSWDIALGFLIKGILENCNTNIVIYLKLNQKLFRGKSMITHLHKFGYEKRQN